MIRLALPKGRNLDPAICALEQAGVDLRRLDQRRLRQVVGDRLEVLLVKDWDVPVYVEHGTADCGVVGTDVLEELGAGLLTPARLSQGRSRMALIATNDELPPPGSQVRIATKYPRWATRLLADRPWGLEVVRLSGSVELGPLLDLADLAVDIVQTGATIRDHGLIELETLAPIAPCLVANRASYQQLRSEMNDLLTRLERAEAVAP